MKHSEVKRHLASYLEGELALDRRALVDAHLGECASCAREVAEMLGTIHLLRALPDPEVPPMIVANVMRRIRAGESQPGIVERIRRGVVSVLEPTFVLPASAVAVAALVVGVLQVGQDESGLRGDSMVEVQSSVTSFSSILPGASARRVVASSAPRPRANVRTQSPRRIHLRIDGSGVSRLSMSRRTSSGHSSGPLRIRQTTLVARPVSVNPVFSSSVPDMFVRDFSRVISGYPAAGGWQSGVLVSASRSDGPFRLPNAAGGLVQPAARSQVVSQDQLMSDLGSTGGDPRDVWLALGFEDPAEFAHFIAGRNLAEQELWVARLSARAEERGLMDEFLRTLRESGDSSASWVADDFAARVAARAELESVGAGGSSFR